VNFFREQVIELFTKQLEEDKSYRDVLKRYSELAAEDIDTNRS